MLGIDIAGVAIVSGRRCSNERKLIIPRGPTIPEMAQGNDLDRDDPGALDRALHRCRAPLKARRGAADPKAAAIALARHLQFSKPRATLIGGSTRNSSGHPHISIDVATYFLTAPQVFDLLIENCNRLKFFLSEWQQ